MSDVNVFKYLVANNVIFDTAHGPLTIQGVYTMSDKDDAGTGERKPHTILALYKSLVRELNAHKDFNKDFPTASSAAKTVELEMKVAAVKEILDDLKAKAEAKANAIKLKKEIALRKEWAEAARLKKEMDKIQSMSAEELEAYEKSLDAQLAA